MKKLHQIGCLIFGIGLLSVPAWGTVPFGYQTDGIGNEYGISGSIAETGKGTATAFIFRNAAPAETYFLARGGDHGGGHDSGHGGDNEGGHDSGQGGDHGGDHDGGHDSGNGGDHDGDHDCQNESTLDNDENHDPNKQSRNRSNHMNAHHIGWLERLTSAIQ